MATSLARRKLAQIADSRSRAKLTWRNGLGNCWVRRDGGGLPSRRGCRRSGRLGR